MLKYKVMRKTLVKIYFAIIRPVLEYSDVVWDNCTGKDSKLLEDLQVEAGRIITGLRCNSSRKKNVFMMTRVGSITNKEEDLIELYRQSIHSGTIISKPINSSH